MSRWLLVGLLMVAGNVTAQTTAQCERSLIHHEARSENLLGQRAVLEVARARAKASGKSVCKVLLERRQFPWATDKTLKIRLALREQTRYNVVRNMNSTVLPNGTYKYFNVKVHKWAYQKVKIGRHTFNNVKEKKDGC